MTLINNFWWRARIRYLLEFEPQETRRLFLSNKKELEERLTEKTRQAVALSKKLENLEPDRRQEIVLNLVAPHDQRPRNQLPETMQEQILEWSENPITM